MNTIKTIGKDGNKYEFYYIFEKEDNEINIRIADTVKSNICFFEFTVKLIALKYLDGSYFCNFKMYKSWEDLKVKYDIKVDEDYLIISVNKNEK